MRNFVRLCAGLLLSSALAAGANAWDGRSGGPEHGRGPIYDITHFDVLPVIDSSGNSFEETAYTALFAYRDASKSDPGFKSFRVVNWLLAANHSQIVDVWRSLDDFEAHLAQPHSVDFRFAVQLPPPPPPGFSCCIGSPIDDRQYSEVASFNTPWTSNSLPSGVGATDSALFVVTYVDFLVDGDPMKAAKELVRYGAATSKAAGQLSYTVLQQLDRANRYATLEVWDTVADYNAWQTDPKTSKFITKVMPLLGSPLDHRLNILCGETYRDTNGPKPVGCVPP